MGDAAFFAMYAMVGAIGVALLAGPIGQAIARRIGGQQPKTGLSTGEMAAERVAQLEQRVHELEERLDFAERMITRSSDAPALGEGTRP